MRGYSLHGLSQQAAAIAFRVLFSLVPLVALTVSLLDLVLPERLSERLVDWVLGSCSARRSSRRASATYSTTAR